MDQNENRRRWWVPPLVSGLVSGTVRAILSWIAPF